MVALGFVNNDVVQCVNEAIKERVEKEGRDAVLDSDARIASPRLSVRGQALAATQGQESEAALPPVQGIQHTKTMAKLAREAVVRRPSPSRDAGQH